MSLAYEEKIYIIEKNNALFQLLLKMSFDVDKILRTLMLTIYYDNLSSMKSI